MTDKPTNIDKVCPLCGGTKDNPQRIGSDPIDDATYICVDWFHGSGTVQPDICPDCEPGPGQPCLPNCPTNGEKQ